MRAPTSLRHIAAFTIMEVMIVMLIITIVAGFIIPNYSGAVEHARERRAEMNLITIHSALKMYNARAGAYPPSGNLAALNTALGLEISDSNFTYTYTNGGATFTVTAARGTPNYTVTITQAPVVSGTNPVCLLAGNPCNL